MTGSRCRILATSIAPDVMRCPTTALKFHFHGVLTGGRFVAILTGMTPCPHRHESEAAARDCTTRSAGGRPPVRIAELARRRAAKRSQEA